MKLGDSLSRAPAAQRLPGHQAAGEQLPLHHFFLFVSPPSLHLLLSTLEFFLAFAFPVFSPSPVGGAGGTSKQLTGAQFLWTANHMSCLFPRSAMQKYCKKNMFWKLVSFTVKQSNWKSQSARITKQKQFFLVQDRLTLTSKDTEQKTFTLLSYYKLQIFFLFSNQNTSTNVCRYCQLTPLFPYFVGPRIFMKVALLIQSSYNISLNSMPLLYGNSNLQIFYKVCSGVLTWLEPSLPDTAYPFSSLVSRSTLA